MKNAIVILVMFLCGLVFSQENEDSIAVPDVSTAIGSSEVSIEENAVPDFTLIFPDVETDFLLSLDVPEVNDIAESDIEDGTSEKTDTSFSLEGIVGGGYPGYFLGDINVQQYDGDTPFAVQFSHESQNGLGSHLPSDGYTHSETMLFGEMIFPIAELQSLKINANYENSNDGFQNKSPLFYQSSTEVVNANITYGFITKNYWDIGMSATGQWMNRYLGRKTTTSEKSSFDAFALGGIFSFGKNFDVVDFYTIAEYTYLDLSLESSHRINFDIDMAFDIKDNFSIDTSLGLVYEKNLSVPVLVPFSVSLQYSDSSVRAMLSGGMQSDQIDYVQMQKKYPYTNIEDGTSEQASWFSTFDIVTPVFEGVTLMAKVHFESTAFNQGYLLPDYANENTVTGLYNLVVQEKTMFDTDIAFSLNKGLYGFKAGWNASWIDVLPEEDRQELFVSASVTDSDNDWGAQLSVTETLFSDYVPIIDCTAFVRLNTMLQLELQVIDIVKLISQEDRSVSGKYVSNTGFVGLFARLYL